MARHEMDREDLLREATALSERAELVLPDESEPVVIGFRTGGAASVFFGGDPVYHFNAGHELRRAFVGGKLYKAEERRLIELRRARSASEVRLMRRDLSLEETRRMAQQALARLRKIERGLQGGSWQLRRQVPAGSDVVGRIAAWLAGLPEVLAVAKAPNVR